MKILRIALDTIGLIGAVALPFWVPLASILILSLRWRAWEVIVIGFLMDLLWVPPGSFFHLRYLFTTVAIVTVWALEPLRKEFLVS
jgi:hypothetical protein